MSSLKGHKEKLEKLRPLVLAHIVPARIEGPETLGVAHCTLACDEDVPFCSEDPCAKPVMSLVEALPAVLAYNHDHTADTVLAWCRSVFGDNPDGVWDEADEEGEWEVGEKALKRKDKRMGFTQAHIMSGPRQLENSVVYVVDNVLVPCADQGTCSGERVGVCPYFLSFQN